MSAPTKPDLVVGCVAYSDAIGSSGRQGMEDYFAGAGVKMDLVLCIETLALAK